MASSSSAVDAPFPFLAPEEWQPMIGSIVLNMRKVGASFDGFEAAMKLDVKEAPGEHGASITFQGYHLAKGSIRLWCWNQEGWDIVQAVVRLVRPTRNAKSPTPFAVFHPALAALDVNKILVESVSAPTWAGQMLSVTLKCIEFAPPPKATKPVTKPLKIADVPTAYGAGKGKEPPIYGPPALPSPGSGKPKPGNGGL